MKVFITGTVVDVQPIRTYQDRSGNTVSTVDFYLASADPRRAADRVTCSPDLAPTAGETVGYWCEARAYAGKYGAVLSVRATEKAAPLQNGRRATSD